MREWFERSFHSLKLTLSTFTWKQPFIFNQCVNDFDSDGVSINTTSNIHLLWKFFQIFGWFPPVSFWFLDLFCYCSLLLNIEQRQILFQSSFLHLSLLRFASHLTDKLQIQSEYSQIFPLLLDCPSSPTSSNRIMHCLWTLCECVAKSARREGPTQGEQRALLCDNAFERGKNRVVLKVKCGRHFQLQRQAPSRGENSGRREKTVALNVNPSSCASNTNTQSNIVVRFRL